MHVPQRRNADQAMSYLVEQEREQTLIRADNNGVVVKQPRTVDLREGLVKKSNRVSESEIHVVSV